MNIIFNIYYPYSHYLLSLSSFIPSFLFTLNFLKFLISPKIFPTITLFHILFIIPTLLYILNIYNLSQISTKQMQAQSSNDFQQRKKQAEMIRKFHPDKIPILLSRNRSSKLKQFDNNKILILKSFTVFKLIMVIKKKLQISYSEAIYVFAGNVLLQADQTIEAVYQKYAGDDRFLHLTYAEYATFGEHKIGMEISLQDKKNSECARE